LPPPVDVIVEKIESEPLTPSPVGPGGVDPAPPPPTVIGIPPGEKGPNDVIEAKGLAV
jgi:hypothetical protein|tara:strand:- start:204 stop:377 length:174 start_codon:yes stop_codon:yes gene_type:complete